MANRIDSGGINPVTRSAGSERAERTARSGESRGGSEAVRSTDSVDITSSAVAMQAAEQAARGTPDVNQERVDAIRSAIASGEYEVDALVVADKLVAFESLLS